MSNTEGEGKDYIPISFREYLEERIRAKCDLWELGLSGLRAEWLLEHRNLIQRFESSERAKILAKTEVDKHFEAINGLQQRMDKLTVTFVDKEELNRRMDDRMKNIWIIIMAVSATLISAFIMHVMGKV